MSPGCRAERGRSGARRHDLMQKRTSPAGCEWPGFGPARQSGHVPPAALAERQTVKKLTLTIEETAATLGIGVCSVRKMVQTGHLKGVRTPFASKLLVSAFSVFDLLGAPREVYHALATKWLAELVKARPAERGTEVVDDATRTAGGNGAGGLSPEARAALDSFWRIVRRDEERVRGGPPRPGAAQRRGVK